MEVSTVNHGRETPHTKIERLAWYATHFPKINQHSLVSIATNPDRAIADKNERITAVLVILKDGIQDDDEVEPLFLLVKDEHDFPITTGDRDSKENNAMLRGDAAIALAKYGLNSPDFIQSLIDILNSITNDPVFIVRGKPTIYLKYFLATLFTASKDAAKSFMEAYNVTKEDLELHLK